MKFNGFIHTSQVCGPQACLLSAAVCPCRCWPGHGVSLGPRLARPEHSRLRHLDTPDPGPELRELLLLQPLYYCQSLSQSEADTGPSQPITWRHCRPLAPIVLVPDQYRVVCNSQCKCFLTLTRSQGVAVDSDQPIRVGYSCLGGQSERANLCLCEEPGESKFSSLCAWSPTVI